MITTCSEKGCQRRYNSLTKTLLGKGGRSTPGGGGRRCEDLRLEFAAHSVAAVG